MQKSLLRLSFVFWDAAASRIRPVRNRDEDLEEEDETGEAMGEDDEDDIREEVGSTGKSWVRSCTPIVNSTFSTGRNTCPIPLT